MRPSVMMMLVSVFLAVVARAQEPQTLLHQYKCDACHANTETKTGPAFVDVAARYRGDSKALATLTAEIKKGKHGRGPWHMPPHPEVSDADAKKMVGYILALTR